MFPKQEIDGGKKYWRRRKPGSSTAAHYASDVRIFFNRVNGKKPETTSVHDVDEFIEWQQSLGRAPATIRTLNIIDDFNREGLWIEVDTSISAARVVRVLDMLVWPNDSH